MVGHPFPADAAETVSIAAAADLAYCLDDMNAAFKKSHPGRGPEGGQRFVG